MPHLGTYQDTGEWYRETKKHNTFKKKRWWYTAAEAAYISYLHLYFQFYVPLIMLVIIDTFDEGSLWKLSNSYTICAFILIFIKNSGSSCVIYFTNSHGTSYHYWYTLKLYGYIIHLRSCEILYAYIKLSTLSKKKDSE